MLKFKDNMLKTVLSDYTVQEIQYEKGYDFNKRLAGTGG